LAQHPDHLLGICDLLDHRRGRWRAVAARYGVLSPLERALLRVFSASCRRRPLWRWLPILGLYDGPKITIIVIAPCFQQF